MNGKKHSIFVLTVFLLLAISVSPVFAGSATGLDNLSYTTRQGWVYLDQNVVVTSTGNNWTGGYLDIGVTSGGDTGDQLRVLSSGSLSVVGDAVSWGGTRIGTIDPTYNGINGQHLRINFSASLLNAGFETGSFSGWTVNNNFAGLPGDTPSGISQYSQVQSATKYQGTYAAQLDISGYVVASCGTAHGPELTSSTFYAQAGNTLSVHWDAIQTGDYYDVYGYLVNVSTGIQQQLFYERGASTNGWRETNTTVNSSVCPSGTCAMRFRFLAGTQDATCGNYVGSTLYIDGINVVTSVATDSMVDYIVEHLEYQNTSDTPTTNKTYTIGMQDASSYGTAAASITIAKANTSTTINSDSPDPSVFGQNYTVNVSVVAIAPSGGTPVGSVEISDGLGGSCNASLSNGSGSCSLPSNSIGARTISAVYGGNSTGYYGSNASTTSHTVNKSSSVTTITSDLPDPSVVGQNYTVNISVTAESPGSGIPGGSVEVTGGSSPCTITLANGAGTCVFASTAPSSNFTLTANYSGDTNFSASSDTELHTINKSPTATSITSDVPDPTVYGQPYTVSASVAAVGGGGGTPGGTVSISDGSVNCNFTLASGSGSCLMPASAPGSKTLTATYGGDSNYSSSSGTSSHIVNKSNSVTTITADDSDPSLFGENYNVHVTVAATGAGVGTPSGSVSVGDGIHNCSASLVNGAGSCSLPSTTIGSISLSASYGGDTNFNSSSDSEPHSISKANSLTVITSDNADPSVFGQNYSVQVSVTAVSPGNGTPSGSVSISDGLDSCVATLTNGTGSCTLPSTVPAEKTLTATYSGDGYFNGSSDEESHSVLKADSSIVILSDLPDPSRYGQSYTVQASVAAVSPGSGVPSGTVLVGDGGETCTITLASGAGSCVLPSTIVGSKTISALYQGDAGFNESSAVAIDHQVIKSDSSLVIHDITPNSTVTGQDYQVSVTASAVLPGIGTPGAYVTISDGNGNVCEITLSDGGGSCSLPSDQAGDFTVSAVYAGDESFNGSSDAVQHTVEKAATNISLTSPYNPAYYGAPLTVTAQVESVLPGLYIPDGQVQFYINDLTYGDPVNLVGGIAMSLALPEARATYAVRAEYLGNENFYSSSAESFDQVVEKAPTTTVVTSSLNPSIYGQNVMFTATIQAVSPSIAIPNGTVQFKVDGVNYGSGVTVDASGKAVRTIPFTALWPDVHQITAVFIPGANFLGSDNYVTPLVQTVFKATPVVTITPAQNPIVSGESTSLSIKLAGSPAYIGIPTGEIYILLDGEAYAGPFSLSVNGTVTLLDFHANSASHEFTILYSGDDYFAETISGVVDPVTINKADSLTVINGYDPTELVVGQSTLVNVTVTALAPGAGIPNGEVSISNGVDECTVTLNPTDGTGSCLLTPTMPGNPSLSAVYSGNDDFNPSSADELTGPIVVKADSHFYSVSFSPNTVVVGQPITITAEVRITAPGSGTATGDVIVSNGSDNCVVTLLNGAGECTFIPSAAGQPNLVFNYAGDSNFNGSSQWVVSGPLVTKAETTIDLFSYDPTELVVGQTTTVNISVVVDEPGSGTPGGSVLVSNGVDECTATLDENGEGSCQFTPTAPGSTDLSATYSGDSNFNSSADTISGPQVEKADTSISSLTFAPDEVVVGQPITMNVIVSVDDPGSGVPSGEVVIRIGEDQCVVTLVAGAGTCDLTPTVVGDGNINAVYSGDLNFNASSLEIAGPMVTSAETSISTFSYEPTNLVVGQPATISIVVSADQPGSGSPTGEVTISNGVDSCVITLVDGAGTCIFTPTAVGTPDLTATYAGDANYLGDISIISGPDVIPADTSISHITFEPTLLVVGQPTTVSVQVDVDLPGSGTPTGIVSISNGIDSCEITLVNGIGACSFTPTNPGQPDVTVEYLGDSNFNPSSALVAGPLVEKANTTSVVSSSEDHSVYGQPVLFTARVSIVDPGAGTLHGSVQFYLDGTVFGEPVELVAGQAESQSIADLALGNHTVWAQYSGNDNFKTSISESITQNVAPAPTAIDLISTRNPAPYGDSVLVIATVTALDPSMAIPVGSVQFKVNGVNYGFPIDLDAEGKAEKVLPYTALWVGTHEVTAVYIPNPRFLPSNNLLTPLLQVIGLADSEISFEASANPAAFGEQVSFTILVRPLTENFLTPTGTVQFSIDGNHLGTALTINEDGAATTIAIGTLSVGLHDISISYSGDEQYAPKIVNFDESLQVNKAETSTSILGWNPDDLVVGQSTNVQVEVVANLPGSGNPNGIVTIGNGVDECEVSLIDGEGNCDLQITIASPFHLVAEYAGSTNFFASSSEEVAGPNVSAAQTSVSSFTFAPAEVVVGEPVTVNVELLTTAPGSGIPTGSVRITNGIDTCDGVLDSSGTGSCELTPTFAGQPDLTATYEGDGNYEGSTDTVSPGPLVHKAEVRVLEISFSPENPVTGEEMSVMVTLGAVAPGSGTPTGSISITINGQLCVVTLVDGVGTCQFNAPIGDPIAIDVEYGGDDNFEEFGPASFGGPDVSAANTTTTISGASNARTNQSVEWMATVESDEPGTGIPNGEVQFFIDGDPFGDPVTLVNGQAYSQSISTLAAGAHAITAVYAGESSYNGSSSSTWTFLVNAYRIWMPMIFR